MLVRSSATSNFSNFGLSMMGEGKFMARDVAPGDYRIVVRPALSGPAQPQSSSQGAEFASVALTVASDIENLVIVTQPGVSISGQLVFADGTPPTLPDGVRITTQPADRAIMMGPAATATVGANLLFTLYDLHGAYFIRTIGLPTGYAVKGVMLGPVDISDTPVEFKPEHSKHLQIVVTSRASTLEGTVTDDNGQPASEVMIFVIPEDKTSWRSGSSRLRMTGVVKEGRFSAAGLIGGRYHVVAVPRDGFFMSGDVGPEFFEPLVKEATTVVIGEDEKRTIDLRVMKRSQD
jgi:hypothetical protein